MDLNQLRCFVAAAEELHFGRAARRVEMLPSALGRFIRLLEEDLGTRLMMRTTRSVTLTDDGAAFLKEARALLTQTDALAAKFRTRGRCCFTISESNGRMSRFNWSRIRRYACCLDFCLAESILLLSALPKARISGWNLCFSFMRPPS
jgi:DNA-binding transcriptional LysR family regulator